MKSPVILRIFKDNQLIEVKQFDQNQIVIGQDADVHLDLKGEGVAPLHCLIELRDSGHYLCDLGSQTGTFKNGQAVLDVALTSGDQIAVGPFKISFFSGVPKPTQAPVPEASQGPKVPPPPLPPEAKPAPGPLPTKVAQPVKTAIPVKVPEKSAPVPKPQIKPASTGRSQRRHSTFAPGSAVKDLRDHLKPTKGSTVEVIVAWQERILTTYHFKTKGLMRAGPGEDYQISLPESAVSKGWPLIEIAGGVRVAVGSDMGFEMIQSQGRKTLDEMIQSGKGTKNSNSIFVRLDQNEMICLSLMSGKIQIFIRYAPSVPVVPLIPALLLSGPEMTGLVMSLVLVGLLAFYISATLPDEMAKEEEAPITRTAQIIFNNPPRPPSPPPELEDKPKPIEPPPQTKAKVADQKQEAQRKGQPALETKAAQNRVSGRATEVAPIPNSQNRPKKFTSTQQGGAIKLSDKQGSNAKSKDLSKVGIFSAFGPGGSRAKLDTSYSGAGEILGQADKATGTSGMDSQRPGDDLGSKFKDTGAGGKGTATEGISGIGTKGRSTGQSMYGATSGFGDKTSVAIEPGDSEADFAGTIDKEAVRRVVRHYLYEIRGCYQKELNKIERGQRLEGKVSISWDIVAKGVAKDVRVKSSTLNNRNVENCIRDRLASWEFPSPPDGMTAEVTFPFYFKPEK